MKVLLLAEMCAKRIILQFLFHKGDPLKHVIYFLFSKDMKYIDIEKKNIGCIHCIPVF